MCMQKSSQIFNLLLNPIELCFVTQPNDLPGSILVKSIILGIFVKMMRKKRLRAIRITLCTRLYCHSSSSKTRASPSVSSVESIFHFLIIHHLPPSLLSCGHFVSRELFTINKKMPCYTVKVAHIVFDAQPTNSHNTIQIKLL